jgi:hypothetical protein
VENWIRCLIVIFLKAGDIEARLHAQGFSKVNARRFAQTVMDDFHAAGVPPYTSGAELNAALGKVVSAAVAMRKAVTAAFFQLPERAPARWKNKADRLPGETPIDFMQRVWGRYIEAGVLYQNDIKRLGDDRLCMAVRAYCTPRGLDASQFLPPPRHARIERALDAADPESAEATALRARIIARAAGKRHRVKHYGMTPREPR